MLLFLGTKLDFDENFTIIVYVKITTMTGDDLQILHMHLW